MKFFKRNYHGKDIPFIPRLLRCTYIGTYGFMRFDWGEFTPSWGFAIQYITGHDDQYGKYPLLNIHLIFGDFFIKMPWQHNQKSKDGISWGRRYGASIVSDMSIADARLYLVWNDMGVFISLPWNKKLVRRSVLDLNGSFRNWTNNFDYPDTVGTKQYSYTYILKSGEVQNRIATVTVEEMEFRRAWLTWCPLFKKVRRYIDVIFDAPVGEKTNNWSAGRLSVSYTMKKGESGEDALRRMEKEKRFDAVRIQELSDFL